MNERDVYRIWFHIIVYTHYTTESMLDTRQGAFTMYLNICETLTFAPHLPLESKLSLIASFCEKEGRHLSVCSPTYMILCKLYSILPFKCTINIWSMIFYQAFDVSWTDRGLVRPHTNPNNRQISRKWNHATPYNNIISKVNSKIRLKIEMWQGVENFQQV